MRLHNFHCRIPLLHVTKAENKTPKPIVSHFRLLEEFKLSLVCVGQLMIRIVDHRRMKDFTIGWNATIL